MASASVKARYNFSGDAFITLCNETLFVDINFFLFLLIWLFGFARFLGVVAAPHKWSVSFSVNINNSKVAIFFYFNRGRTRQSNGLFATILERLLRAYPHYLVLSTASFALKKARTLFSNSSRCSISVPWPECGTPVRCAANRATH